MQIRSMYAERPPMAADLGHLDGVPRRGASRVGTLSPSSPRPQDEGNRSPCMDAMIQRSDSKFNGLSQVIREETFQPPLTTI